VNEEKQPEKKETDQETKEDLEADRDDALGYSREQLTFEEEPEKSEKEKEGH
jgi:hypothetical protein